MNEEKLMQDLPQENFGLPGLNLDDCSRDGIPSDWEIDAVLSDILMCKYVDENIHGEVLRDGIWMQVDVTQHLWRVCEVIKIGPECKEIKVGDRVMVPGGRGIPGVSKGGEKLIFLNEQRVFAVVKARE